MFEINNLENYLRNLSLKKIIILGLGEEGLSTYNFLRNNFSNKKFYLIDEKPLSKLNNKWQEIYNNDKNIAFFTNLEDVISEINILLDNDNNARIDINSNSNIDNNTHTSDNANDNNNTNNSDSANDNNYNNNVNLNNNTNIINSILVIKSPGISPKKAIIKQINKLRLKLTSNTSIFLELIKIINKTNNNYPTKIETVGVTGTKGKSTTASMIYHVLKNCYIDVFLGGNIGLPPLSLWGEILKTINSKSSLLDFDKGKKFINNEFNNSIAVILEMSSHQLNDIDLSPSIAVILDITPEHLDYYDSFDKYVKAKSQIVKSQTKNDLVIFNDQQKIPTQLANISKAEKITFNLEKNLINGIITYNEQTIINANQLPVLGNHNILNSIPSIIIAKKFGCKINSINKALQTFEALPHRLEIVANRNNITYINDSLSTTPESTIAAIKSFNNSPIILIVGGYKRNLSFAKLAETINNDNVKYLILLPDTGKEILKDVIAHKQINRLNNTSQIGHTFVKNMRQAVEIANSIAKKGDIVLLSPAAASFGHFIDYQDRGEQFRELVSI